VIKFILNNQTIETEKEEGGSLLDFIRTEMHLTATKIGCREGDCGACTVLEGSLDDGVLTYKSIVSCLTPLVNVHAKHIVTVEGLNLDDLSPVQNAMSENSATQCGFCTPGFVVALTGHLLSPNNGAALDSLGGNICRCTGYKSIEKAATKVDELKQELLLGSEIEQMIQNGWLPDYFSDIEHRLVEIKDIEADLDGIIISGGTDLMVQQAESIRYKKIAVAKGFIPNDISEENGKLKIGAGIKINDFFHKRQIIKHIPQLVKFFPLIASEQIRNMGTLAGNIVNASPIGDISIMLLALDAKLLLENKNAEQRQLALKDFFINYKETSLKPEEIIKHIMINPDMEMNFNFEKVSKRTYLDIATVNTAMSILVKDKIIREVYFSAGGIAAVPMFMRKSVEFLKGKELSVSTLESVLSVIQSEISPISDIRGSSRYKRLLLRQLFLQHFLKLFPEKFKQAEILNIMTTNNLPYEEY
jgi:xanthine dehydrogenase small subunit